MKYRIQIAVEIVDEDGDVVDHNGRVPVEIRGKMTGEPWRAENDLGFEIEDINEAIKKANIAAELIHTLGKLTD